MKNYDELLSKLQKDALQEKGLEKKQMLERIEYLKEHQGDDRIVSSHEIEKALENEPKIHTIKTGWEGIDALTGGFSYEQLIILSAQEKSGKTTFALELLDRVKDEKPCAFLFEQSPREIIRQLKDRGQEIPMFYTPFNNTGSNMEWLQERALESFVKHGSKLFLIDNFDWLEKDYQRYQNSEQAYRQILIDLKNFCKQWGIVIILVVHVVKLPFEVIPQPNDIKGSSAFKQIADTVLILWRKTEKEKIEGTLTRAPRRTNETLLWVAENRRTGSTGYAQLVYDKGRYLEKVWDDSLSTSEQFNYDTTN